MCLTQFHRKSACKSTNKYRKCGKSHPIMLHVVTPSEPNLSISRDANNSAAPAKGSIPILCTALVNVCDSFRLCRALLIPGSQACLITNSCLGILRKRACVRISCLGASDTRTNGRGQLPHFSLDPSWSEPFSDLKLADPTFFKSGPIDTIIEVNIAILMLKGQSLSLGDNKPFAVNSIQVVTDELGSNFSKLDSIPEASLLTSEERACEDHFIKTHVRNEDGRYVVRLPFHSPPSKLGDSRESAIRRFNSLEHSLIKKPAIYSQYRDFMQEYLTLGHMELVPKHDYAIREAYYLPHHAVLRDSSTTTKLRVVFDASAKSTTGHSLNDLLMVGPRVQRDVYPILLSFRTFQIAVCADLEKMFRQIKISSEDTNWQRIL
ncbi:integrase catalytic domain-containing protein [Trichonephila inaurata madagascariensis]|uniref:Integrase catalytic domain-containing protein n=1 Tax=Trichonephila inaurata madagascariensis TaxID=2747483 RepID=A0A8X6IJN9_9ARAC|nr:integrase catalytic domain-containing protein [Trichonephila inaurata madagascariensis]